MSCACKPMEKAPTISAEGQRLDIPAVVARNVQIIEAGREQRTLAFPDLRERFGGAELISTFSHLNPNLPIDEVYGNCVLQQMAERLELAEESVFNCAYDNIQPGHDAPKGYRIQYVIVNPPALNPEQVIHLQEEFRYDPQAVVRDGQNRIKSAPEQNIEAFRQRYEELEGIFLKHAGRGQVSERICRIRSDFLGLVELPVLSEEPFSRRLMPIVADVLEALAQKGYPFWEVPVPAHRDRYVEYTFLVEGVDAQKRRQPTRYENGLFRYRYDESTERRIPQDEVFEALRQHQLIPTMPLVILATATASQLPHLGGRVWKGYAPIHVDAQATWLGIEETSATLILSTEGYKPLVTYRQNQEFTGFPAVYLTYGAALIRKALTEGLELRTEFKRVVF